MFRLTRRVVVGLLRRFVPLIKQPPRKKFGTAESGCDVSLGMRRTRCARLFPILQRIQRPGIFHRTPRLLRRRRAIPATEISRFSSSHRYKRSILIVYRKRSIGSGSLLILQQVPVPVTARSRGRRRRLLTLPSANRG